MSIHFIPINENLPEDVWSRELVSFLTFIGDTADIKNILCTS